jgi:hypothetical protein
LRSREARLGEEAREYCLGARQGRCLVPQLFDERVAPGGDVGVEVLEGERIGPKARADAQVDARHHRVGRAMLARDVLDQTRAPAHGVRALLVHGEAKGVDARRLLGPVGGGHASSGCRSGHNRGYWWWRGPQAAICRPLPKHVTQSGCDASDQLLKRYKWAYIRLLSFNICRSVAFEICV